MSRCSTLCIVLTALVYTVSGCALTSKRNLVPAPEAVATTPSCETETSVSMTEAESAAGGDTRLSPGIEDMATFTNSSSILEGDTYGVVVVKGPNTTLTVSGGCIHKLVVKDASRVSVNAGVIRELYIYDSCNAVISGGEIGTIYGYGKNTVTIKERAVIETVQSYGATRVVVNSSDAAIDTIQYFTRCGCVDQSQSVQLELARGRFGNIGTGSTEVSISITGYRLSKSAYGGDYGFGWVKGRWKDGDDFSINFTDESTFGHTVLYRL